MWYVKILVSALFVRFVPIFPGLKACPSSMVVWQQALGSVDLLIPGMWQEVPGLASPQGLSLREEIVPSDEQSLEGRTREMLLLILCWCLRSFLGSKPITKSYFFDPRSVLLCRTA